jgi:hypothetical protein
MHLCTQVVPIFFVAPGGSFCSFFIQKTHKIGTAREMIYKMLTIATRHPWKLYNTLLCIVTQTHLKRFTIFYLFHRKIAIITSYFLHQRNVSVGSQICEHWAWYTGSLGVYRVAGRVDVQTHIWLWQPWVWVPSLLDTWLDVFYIYSFLRWALSLTLTRPSCQQCGNPI